MSTTFVPRSGLAVLACGLVLGAHAADPDVKSAGVPQQESATPQNRDTVQSGGIPASKDESGLQEIVVTARRREEKAQTVPIAITTVTEQTLQDNNAHTFEDLAHLVPSMSVMRSGLTRNSILLSIRGQGTNSLSGQPGVVAYLNEAPLLSDHDGNLAGGPGLLFDLENVQVVKGPQGTLFGRNSVGGDLLLQTARPTNSFGGRLQVGFGNYHDREIDGAINIPIVDGVLLTRVAFNGQLRDGFTLLQGEPLHPNGIDADNQEYWSMRGTIAFRPSDQLQNDTFLTFSRYYSNGSPQFLVSITPGSLLAQLGGAAYSAALSQQQALGSRTHIPIDDNDISNGSNLSASDTLRYKLSDEITARNILSYEEFKYGLQFDGDLSALPLLRIPYQQPQVFTHRQITEEVQLQGTSFDDHLNWTAGLFYLDVLHPDFTLLQVRLFGVPGLPLDGESKPYENSKALYAQGTYNLSRLLKGLDFTAGVRYTWDDRAEDDKGGVAGSICTPPPTDCTATTHHEAKTSALTWTLTLDDRVTPNTLLYLTARRGYRAGGFNGPGQPSFDPEYVNDLELGVKSDFHLGVIPMRINADLYHQDYKDIQVQHLIENLTAGLVPVTGNAARGRIDGAELDAYAQVTKDLELGPSFAYTNLRYTEFLASVPADTIATLNANRTFNNPPRKYGLNAIYHVPIDTNVGEVSVKVNWNGQSSSSGSLGTASQVSQAGGTVPGYGLLNMAVDWNNIYGHRFDASLFGSNVTDRQYFSSASTSPFGSGQVRYGEPRFYGVRFRYRF
jgi:iron complex outermembrane receptor protein